MSQLQTELGQKTVSCSSGGGMVTATADGRGKLRTLKIDPTVVQAGDVEMLEDLVLAAVNEVQNRAQAAVRGGDAQALRRPAAAVQPAGPLKGQGTAPCRPSTSWSESWRACRGSGARRRCGWRSTCIKSPEDEARRLARSIVDVREKVRPCGALRKPVGAGPLRHLPEHPARRLHRLRGGGGATSWPSSARASTAGLYHVLGGRLSPLDGIGPAELNVRPLLDRVGGGGVAEVVLATNPSVEGEATALYLGRHPFAAGRAGHAHRPRAAGGRRPGVRGRGHHRRGAERAARAVARLAERGMRRECRESFAALCFFRGVPVSLCGDQPPSLLRPFTKGDGKQANRTDHRVRRSGGRGHGRRGRAAGARPDQPQPAGPVQPAPAAPPGGPGVPGQRAGVGRHGAAAARLPGLGAAPPAAQARAGRCCCGWKRRWRPVRARRSADGDRGEQLELRGARLSAHRPHPAELSVRRGRAVRPAGGPRRPAGDDGGGKAGVRLGGVRVAGGGGLLGERPARHA